ncbi:mechanosensitive ion channel [Synechocystis sp. FACHB-383]|uniref:mechanosensitive ion channel family protein n=1 Tax=Synechocystis sp. FACHB-383 TaxID=2692864 RepID=UPI001687BDD4|nr:mechanosensitive ion channel domain-containing protein [Synechocystis sp. FACHB-383]MBD2653520.1 mechanosensitive ion channel [Synechocystis sp. FACHB-383]
MNQSISDLDFSPLESVFFSFWHMGQRPLVQGQLVLILGAMITAYATAKIIWWWLRKKYHSAQFFLNYSPRRSPLDCLLWAGHFFLLPSLLFLLLLFVHTIYRQHSYYDGLIDHAIILTLIFIFYRAVIFFASFCFPIQEIEYYRSHLFRPILFYFFVASTINLVEDYLPLVSTPFFDAFQTPVTIRSILLITFGVYLWVILSSLICKIIIYLISNGSQFDPGFIRAVSVLINYGLIGFGLFGILGYVGINPAIFATVTGGLSVGIGFGLKEVISNFVSGVWLLMEGALKPGDVINVGGEMSRVERLGLRAATVNIIRDNTDRIIPNQVFFTEEVNTYTGRNHLVYCSVIVGASYKANPRQVIDLLLDLATDNPDILPQPKPAAFLLDFADSSMNFEIKFWLDNPVSRKKVSSELRCRIWQKFKELDIEIPYPQRDLHLRTD